MSKTVIIGAGISGLSCAFFLKKPYIIIEKEGRPGGLCKSFSFDGFTFDHSGHFFHVKNKEIKSLILRLMKNNIAKIERNAFIFSNERFIPFPFQANLFNLPAHIKNECLQGFINKPAKDNADRIESFYKWSLETFGKGITKYFMKPYNEKLWTVPAKELTSEWVAPFVPQPTLQEVKSGAKKAQAKRFGYNSYFYYPRKGGCQAFIDALVPHVKNLELGVSSKKIDTLKKIIFTSDGRKIHYDNIISTQPLNLLLGQVASLPPKIKGLAKKLRWNSVTCINIGIKKHFCNQKILNNKHWVYYPDKDYVFYRAGVYSNIMPGSTQRDSSSFYIEISHKPGAKIDKNRILSKTIKGLIDSRLIRSTNDIEVVNWLDIPYAYVIYDRNRAETVENIHKYLTARNIFSIGRYGAWKYSFMEESMLDAIKIIKEIR
ncbi:MAG: NAD(P)-binding protein [Elusimicrobia bacterium]|nr:NAD(P)-binding protein [Candidatus Liberimonas magnetica]